MKDGKVLLLKKPRRGWYVAPGGKIESGESIYEAATREFFEETNVKPLAPHLKGVYTMLVQDDNQLEDEWMLFTFLAKDYEGTPFTETREGQLEWHPINSLTHLPMDEGDRRNLLFAVTEPGIQYGTFEYTKDLQLISEKIQISTEG